ncbi:MAG: hypothetical protein H0W16_04850 [Actinobacteria bacterium]|nr:hypothetical protein [Actinomycetota bacterium]
MNGFVAEALRVRRNLAWSSAVGLGYLVLYLWAIQNLILAFDRDLTRFVPVPSVQVVPDWTDRMFEPIAPFYYESVIAIYPVNHVTLLVSPLNLAMGLVLTALVALNVAVALQVVRTGIACRRSFAGVLGALPGFLTGFACCVPTFALVLGAQFTLALIALRSWFFPFALAAMLLSLAWNARRGRRLAAPASLGLSRAASPVP